MAGLGEDCGGRILPDGPREGCGQTKRTGLMANGPPSHLKLNSIGGGQVLK